MGRRRAHVIITSVQAGLSRRPMTLSVQGYLYLGLGNPLWNLELGPLRRPLLHNLHVWERTIEYEELEARETSFILIADRSLIRHAPHSIVRAQPLEECLITTSSAQSLSWVA